jgi:hypothetical protein
MSAGTRHHGGLGSWSCKNAILRRGGLGQRRPGIVGVGAEERRRAWCAVLALSDAADGLTAARPHALIAAISNLLPHDVDDASKIVGEDVQRHLARDTRQRLHQEVHRSHARLDRREGVLDRLAPLAHGLRVLIEPPLHGFENMLMLPARDPALFGWRAFALDRAAWAGVCPRAT